MQILALDASTDVCSVALGDGVDWHERSEIAGQRHSELLIPMIQALLAEFGATLARVDGVAFGAGPGSFTGLRIACGVAQGLALGADLPIVGVSTLEAIAQTRRDQSGEIASLPRSMRGCGKSTSARTSATWAAGARSSRPLSFRPTAAPVPEGGNWIAAGSGFAAYPSLLKHYGATVSENRSFDRPRRDCGRQARAAPFCRGRGSIGTRRVTDLHSPSRGADRCRTRGRNAPMTILTPTVRRPRSRTKCCGGR